MFLRKVTIDNFRGFGRVEVELDEVTVLIGENNSGKTSFLEAIKFCLARPLSRRGSYFEDYDHHLTKKDGQPGDAGMLAITLDFAESKQGEWADEIVQTLPDVVVVHPGDIRHVTLRITSQLDKLTGDFAADWEFLDAAGKGLGPKSKTPAVANNFQRLCPAFYLSALRDAGREFAARSTFWGPFLKNPSIDAKVRTQLEGELNELNKKILDAHGNLKKVQDNLGKTQKVLPLGVGGTVTLEALPGRVSDMLSRTQVNMLAPTGVSLPLLRHGAGTQSLSVIFLFEAFLESMLTQAFDKLSEPILALEEPEAHLHPCAIRCMWSVFKAMKGQKIIATHSGDLLAEVPLKAIRRFCRSNGQVAVHRVKENTLAPDDLRKLEFHVQANRGELFFAKCWLLCEGETEHWVLRRAAQILKLDLERDGVRIVTITGPGVETLVKVANDLNICWHLLSDNDKSGQSTCRWAAATLHGFLPGQFGAA